MTQPPVLTDVSARIEAEVTRPAELVFSVAVASGPAPAAEDLRLTVGDASCPLQEIVAPVGGRLHVASVPAGPLVLEYSATASGSAPAGEPTAQELVTYRRPSRYAESDKLGIVASKRFAGAQGWDLVDGVVAWVHDNLLYVSGSSGPTDGAVDTYLAQQGVCRDYAHLTLALLRGCGLPARLVSVYAPGLAPMDFHAVVEVAVDGAWHLVDATRLAPRASMVRIATGRDAADTAFLTVHSGGLQFGRLDVTCVRHGELPVDRPGDRVRL